MSSDVAKCNQVVFECMQKVAEVIVSSRVLHQRLKSGRSINSKFSLHIEELAFVRHSMEAWKDDLHMPLGIDIFWQEHRRGDSAPHLELLERWEIAYELQDSVESKSSQLRHIYKRAIILLRTLYSFVRMMPAYQVYRRIQKAYDNRDRSMVDTRNDLGFCLYPILENGGGGGGSGLDFGEIPVEDHGHVAEDSRDPSIGSYSFKPLETPQGKVLVKVTYQRGTNSKALQHGQTTNSPTPSITPNMTSSIIQDYVPDEYEGEHLRHDVRDSVGIVVEGDAHQDYRPRLATTPEDATSASRRPVESDQQGGRIEKRDDQGGIIGPGTLHQHDVDSVTPRATVGEKYRTSFETPPSRNTGMEEGNVGPSPDVLHWPLLEQGHGYTAKRVSNVTGQGPAPFLTPGPHRHKLVPSRRQGMEPLDLGPTVMNDVYEREAGQPAVPSAPRLQPAGHVRSLTRDCGDCYDSARRDSSDDSSIGGVHNQSHSLNTQGSVKGCVGRGDIVPIQDKFQFQTNRRTDANSEGKLVHGMPTAIGHHHSSLLNGAPESTPPFSYCEESIPARPIGTEVDGSPLRLSQPLVTFSPPFYADPVEHRTESEIFACESVKGNAPQSSPPPLPPNPAVQHQRSKVMYSAPRASLVALGASDSPALLETLPESPFAGRAQGRPNLAMEMGTSAVAGPPPAFLQPPLVQRTLDSSQTSPLQALGAKSFDEQEELPFATEVHDGFEALEQDGHISGSEIGINDSKGTLFALCSGFNSTSVILTRESHPGQAQLPSDRYDRADFTSNADEETSTHAQQEDAENTVRTLEEELDGFRQFHQELERRQP